MSKEFDVWNGQKKRADAKPVRPHFSEREVWWCSFGVNIGDEEDGKGETFTRPILVLRKFNANIFWGIALSTQIKESPYYHRINFKDAEQSVILSQLRLTDAKRLGKRMGVVSEIDFEAIKQKVKDFLS